MFRNLKIIILVLVAGLMVGCAAVPQQPIQMNQSVFSSKTSRVGIVMAKLPKVDTEFPGAGCLLCYAAASAANSSLTAHTKTLPYDDLPKIKADIADLIRKKGNEVTVIDEDIELKELPSYSKKNEKTAPTDFSSITRKYNLDKLIVLNIQTLGFIRPYSSYFPVGEPYAVFNGVGYMVNSSDNNYDWYLPVTINKHSDRKWDEAPNFPGLSNAYFQALELGRDQFLKPFKEENLGSVPQASTTKNAG